MPASISIKKTFTTFNTQQQKELKVFANMVQDDLAALRAAIVGITAKLDADAGVTDTTYASLWDPAALKTTD